VQKLTSGVTTHYVYDAFGRLAAEYTTATPTITAGSYWRTTDHLGSTRLVTTSAGAAYDRRDPFPLGEQIDTYSGRSSAGNYNDSNPTSRHLFTAKERDVESGLDYFLARYMSSALGRFTSVDPENAGATRSDPQSWNGYAYVTNRPLTLTDPDGRCPNCATGATGFGIGFVIGAGAETFRQAKEQFSKGGRIQLDGNKILASGVGTGIFGAAVGIGGAAGVAGGVVERSIDSDSSTAPVSAGDVKADAISGVGGVLVLTCPPKPFIRSYDKPHGVEPRG
jgi:RHS repeat-associated protein